MLVPFRHPDSTRAPALDAQGDSHALRPSLPPSSRPSFLPNTSIAPGSSLHAHSVLLSAVAGYVDAAGFASLIGLLPAHITGELVGDAIAFSAGQGHTHPTHLWAVPVFVGAVVTATLVTRIRRRNGQNALPALLCLVTAALALFSASDEMALLLHQGGRWPVLFGGACAVAAMGFQNTLMRESLRASCPTTVMTGNLTQVVIEIVDHVFGKFMSPSPRDRRPRVRFRTVGSSLLAFISCAVLGGFLTHAWGSASAILPTLVTGLLTVQAVRENARAQRQRVMVPSISPAPVPKFDAQVQQVWPDSMLPGPPAEPVSFTMLKADAVLSTPEAAPEKPPMKRTVSGTRIKAGFAKEEAK